MAEMSVEPVKCGCVLIKDNKTLASAFNSQRHDEVAVNHAEIKAIVIANRNLKKRRLEG